MRISSSRSLRETWTTSIRVFSSFHIIGAVMSRKVVIFLSALVSVLFVLGFLGFYGFIFLAVFSLVIRLVWRGLWLIFLNLRMFHMVYGMNRFG